MSKKNHSPGPVPAGNKTNSGPGFTATEDEDEATNTTNPKDQEQDPQRRLGDFSGKGEHPRQQPTNLNDGNSHNA